MRTLASDAFEGREAGTPGYDKAAEYVAERFAAIGLAPAGEGNGWFQRVPLLKATREEAGAALVVARNGREIALRFRDQFLPAPNYDAAASEITAPAVFVGFGVHAPDLGHDDFAIFDTFPSDAGRLAHLAGKVGRALVARTPELLDGLPKIEDAQVLAYKLTDQRGEIRN